MTAVHGLGPPIARELAEATCPFFRKLYPNVFVVKSAKDGDGEYHSVLLDRPVFRGLLGQGKVRSRDVVVFGVRR